MRDITRLSLIASVMLFTACGSGDSNSTDSTDIKSLKTGFFIDGAVGGLGYITTSGETGVTDSRGAFKYRDGESVNFFIGKLLLGDATPTSSGLVTPKILSDGDNGVESLILRTLQSLDRDNNTSNGIDIKPTVTEELDNLDRAVEIKRLNEKELLALGTTLRAEIDSDNNGNIDIDETEAYSHFQDSIKNFENSRDGNSVDGQNGADSETTDNNGSKDVSTITVIDTDNTKTDDGKKDDTKSDDGKKDDTKSDDGKKDDTKSDDGKKDDEDKDNNSNGGTTTSSNKYMLTAWNDLGMHCMDGNDFSVFSVLPPYNNLHAQLKDKNGDLITSGVTITYESTLGVDGKINTTSVEANNGVSKTNFWSHASDLFGASLADNIGLTGKPTSTKTPEPLTFNATHQWWEAEGIPITPYNDDGTKNYYPLVKVVAKDLKGTVLASVDTVLPVSDEMDCKRCHATDSLVDAKPTAGWVKNIDAQKDYKYNILRLHDDREPNAVKNNASALKAKGYNYNIAGLEATAKDGTAILCVACHKSNALPNIGIEIKPFTQAIHEKHSNVTDPLTGKKLGDSSNRTSCYACHPGASTECLRGAMGDAKNADGTSKMQCQSCHGTMNHVGASNREGWLDQPNCQACHHDGKREVSAIDPRTNTLRNAVDTRFATNPNTPMAGKSLYRFSRGHGKLQCEACHGSTHAIYPAHEADNKVSMAIQGHTGTVAECSSCHTKVPKTTTGGPHGMHPVGQSWVKNHEDIAEDNPAQCKVCHGSDYRGSNLSKTWTDRTLDAEEFGTKKFAKGHKVGCYDCHNGPNGD
jgi:hypothetical protein